MWLTPKPGSSCCSRRLLRAKTAEEALRLAIHTVFRRVITQTEQSNIHLRLMLNEMVNPSSVLTDELEATIRPLYDRFRKLVGDILKLPIDPIRARAFRRTACSAKMVHYVHAASAGPLMAREADVL